VEHGYLEFANPVLRDGLERLRARGATRILAVPGMLFAAMHAKNDIPTVLSTWAAKAGVPVAYGRELGVDPKMVAAGGARVREALARADAETGPVPLHETCLVVIGRGASDPDANANVSKVARLLWEGLGLGWCEVGYSGVTFPLVEPVPPHVARLGYRRVVVFPTSCSRACWWTASTASPTAWPRRIRASSGSRPAIWACTRRCCAPSRSGRPSRSRGAAAQLPDVQVPHAGPGLRGRGGRAAGKPPPPCRGPGASAPGSNVADCTLCDDFCTGLCRLEVGGWSRWAVAHRGGGHFHDHGDGHVHWHGPAGHPTGTTMGTTTRATRTRTIPWARSRRLPR
jgi:sirohydrochlorin cobaltochelatase